MTPESLFKHAPHFDNFTSDQLADLFNWEEVAALPDDGFNRERVRLLSQYMVGNVSATFAEIAALPVAEQRRCLHTWVDLLQGGEHRKLCIDILVNMFTEQGRNGL